MSDTSKYDFFMDEIVSLEKMIQNFVAENQEIEFEKIALAEKAKTLEKENEILILKIKELEKNLTKQKKFQHLLQKHN